MTKVEINNNEEALKHRQIENDNIRYIDAIFNKSVEYDLSPSAQFIKTEDNEELFLMTEEPETATRYNVGYLNVEFKDAVTLSNINISIKKIVFQDCIFSSKLSAVFDIDNIDNDTLYMFENCTFNDCINISGQIKKWKELKSKFRFNRCTFYESVEIARCVCDIDDSTSKSEIKIAATTKITKSKIQNLALCYVFSAEDQYRVKILRTDISVLSTPSHESCSPKSVASTSNLYAIVGGKVSEPTNANRKICCYYNVTFENRIYSDGNGYIDIYADNCSFTDRLLFHKGKFMNVKMSECIFDNKFWISDSELHNLSLINCKFKDTVKIYNIENPIKSACFNLSTVEGLFLFNGWDRRLKFDVDAKISFSNIFVGVNGYLIIRKIGEVPIAKKSVNNGFFDFTDSNILGVIVFNDIYTKKIDLTGASIIGSFNAENIHIDQKLNRDTCLKLKNEFIKKQDSVNASLYKAKEMRAYYKSLKLWSKNCPDKILLLFNWLSSRHDQSWLQAIVFTIIAAFLSYSSYFALTEWNNLIWFSRTNPWVICDGDFLKEVLSFLWILDTGVIKELASNTQVGFCGLFVYVLGKILVGYGIYQTISAFRKLGKK